MVIKIIYFTVLVALLSACSVSRDVANQLPTQIAAIFAIPKNLMNPTVPVFNPILMIIFENRAYQQVIGNQKMPTFNHLAHVNVLLTQSYAVSHPSLPNYIALVSGDTYGITNDCTTCFLNQPNLADLIEKSGRTWKTYQEGMPSPCYTGDSTNYAQKHNPFIYFDDIRTDSKRCSNSVVPISELDQDLKNLDLPNFAFITPNLCNDAHSCSSNFADQWLEKMLDQLQTSGALGEKYLIVITFDESAGDNSSCCGLGERAGGHVATILISPLAKSGFEDTTPYSHYSLLKTIETSWGLPLIGSTAKSETPLITAPWK